MYYYNGAQRYERFLQVGQLYRALILLGLALLSSERLRVFGLHGAIYLLCPRPRRGGGGIRRSSASVVRPSVCLMSRTSALTRKPKGLGRRNFAQGYPRSHATTTPTSRSKVKVTGRWHIVTSTKRAATWRTATDITSLKYYLILQCL